MLTVKIFPPKPPHQSHKDQGRWTWLIRPIPPVVQAGRASTVRLRTNTDTRTMICVACLNTEKTD